MASLGEESIILARRNHKRENLAALNNAVSMNETSLSLLDRARGSAGDDAWPRLADVYSPLLRSWLLRFEVEAADADDLVQDVLLTISRELPRFEHSGRMGAFRSWLRTILVHRVRDFWRSKKYRPTADGGSSWAERLEQLIDDATIVCGCGVSGEGPDFGGAGWQTDQCEIQSADQNIRFGLRCQFQLMVVEVLLYKGIDG